MTLDEFDDKAMASIVRRAMGFIRFFRGRQSDAYQAGFLAALELRRQLRISSPGTRILNRKHIALSVYKAIARELRYRDSDMEIMEADALAPGGGLDFSERELLNRRMARLSARELNIIRRQYFDGVSTVEIGAEIGVSKQRVSIISLRALQKMRGEVAAAAASNN